MQKLFKKDLLQKKLAEVISEKVWKELSLLKAQIDTGDRSSAPYNLVTTSMYLTGNQILLRLTRDSLRESLERDIYSAIYEAGLESQSIEGERERLKRLEEKLKFQLEQKSVKSLKEEIKGLQKRLGVWERAAEQNGYVYE